ncbi:MAG: hypothetical protein KDE53_38355 [Caldilineaceae bacterium]|nr:hypothetical protein [Caldilineaceae bacterium]
MIQPGESKTNTIKPDYVSAMEAVYGVPSQEGFGSAVFYVPTSTAGDLEQIALAHFRYFVGDLWERYGEDAWMDAWRQVYKRLSDAERDIVAELRALDDCAARLSASLIVDEMENTATARAALSAAFDDGVVTELCVYKVGDGGALSGILVAARRAATCDMLFLVFLID